jgi:hypothetical protein
VPRVNDEKLLGSDNVKDSHTHQICDIKEDRR